MKWTKEPPKEPGWYWRRKWNGPDEWEVKVVHVEQLALEDEDSSFLHVVGDSYRIKFVDGQKLYGERIPHHPRHQWWPIPIPAPQEEP